MKKSISLFVALLLLSSGWAVAFLLANNASASQVYWLMPALILGMGVGLCLRFVNGKKTALTLALTAALGLAIVNQFFPASRVSFDSVRALFSGSNPQGTLRQVKVEKRFQTAPFDQPMLLISPLSVDVSIFTRLPAGVEDFCFTPDGTLYASLPSLGVVYRIEQAPNVATRNPELFLHSLDNPSGLSCNPDRLLVSESSQITAYPYRGGVGTRVVGPLPDDGGELGHRIRQIPEGLLFSVGSRCDACDEKNPMRATLQLLDPAGQLQTYSKGLRNIGGIAFNQEDGSLWVSERSRLYPEPGAADELNRLQAGRDYGWPLCEGDRIDSEQARDCTAAERLLRSRANPAGIMSTAGLNYPLVYLNSLLMVLQGDSAYRIVPAVVRIQISQGKVGVPVAFLGGWDGKTARPSALHPGPDGAVYIADDLNGAIYRVVWQRGD